MISRTLLTYILFATSAPAIDSSILTSAIPGEGQVRLASARPAPRAFQLLYACGIDQYLEDHRLELDRLKFAYRQCLDSRDTAIYIFRNYRKQYSRFSEDGDPETFATQRAALEAFLGSGYDGLYLPELREHIQTLKALEKATEQGAAANP